MVCTALPGIAAECGNPDVIKALDEGLIAANNAHEVGESLKALDDGSTTEPAVRRAFCAWSSNAAGGQSLDWKSFAENQVGVSSDDPVDEKIDELDTAVALAQNNPQIARMYVQGCVFNHIPTG